MNLQQDQLLSLGVAIGTHGLRGGLKVRGTARDFPLLARVRRLVFLREGAVVARAERKKADWHKGMLVLQLAGIGGVDAAQSLVGCEVAVVREDVPASAPGSHYWFQLEGLAAYDRRLGAIGRLEDIFSTAAHDIYVIQGDFGEVLVPAVDAFVVEVDLENRRVLFDLPEGLVQEA